MTVSRALSNSPNVQKETREAVQKRARELGYVKSAAAMMMRGDTPKIVGLLLPNIVNEFYARFANDMAIACDQQSLQLIIHLTNDDVAIEQQALDRLQEVQAASVVMVPAPRQTGQAAPITGSLAVIDLIRLGRPGTENPAILVDDGPAIRAAVQHLAKAGHQDIAYIGANQKLSSGRTRLDAFLQGIEDAGLDISQELIHTGTPSFAMGRAQAEVVVGNGRATALLCGGFEISNGALSALIESPKASEQELAFIGYGDPSFYAWVNKGVSTIRVPVTELALQAAEMATKSKQPRQKQVSFAAELVLR